MDLYPEAISGETGNSGNGCELTGLALCAGMSGLELGIQIAEPGYRTLCFVERQAFCASALMARMADKALDQAVIWSDVKSFRGEPWRGRVSVVSGGYPCQPFSTSGKRRGEQDPRHLWPHIREIVRAVRPEWCFFENVEGHLTPFIYSPLCPADKIASWGAEAVINDLSAMGFKVKAGLFSAVETGAAHIRRRLFIMAYADSRQLWDKYRDCAGAAGNKISGRPERERLAVCDKQSGGDVDADAPADAGLRSGSGSELSIPLFAPAPSHFALWEQVLRRRPDLQPCVSGLDNGLADRPSLPAVDAPPAAAGSGIFPLAAAYAWRTLKAAFAEQGGAAA